MEASPAETQKTSAVASPRKPTHSPLDLTKRQIRLLFFCADGKDDAVHGITDDLANVEIKCTLSAFDLSDCPEFTGLSYVWGPPDEGYEITLNGYPYRVRANLFAALQNISRHLRAAGAEDKSDVGGSMPGLSQYIWIDAVCINQDDIDERNQQVQMMTAIYKTASLVFVWLGLECEESLQAIKTADPMALATTFDNDWFYQLRDTDLAKQVVPFLEATYWTRMWVLQEFLLARDIVLASGNTLVPWDQARQMFLPIQYTNQPDYHQPVYMANERRHRMRGHNTGSSNLVKQFGRLECVDHRDRIFALFGVLGDPKDDSPNEEYSALIVDYRLTPVEVAARYIILTAKFAFAEKDAWLQVEPIGALNNYLPGAMDFSKEDLEEELRHIESEAEDGCWLGVSIQGIFSAIEACEMAELYSQRGY